jgi:Transposase IS66 family
MADVPTEVKLPTERNTAKAWARTAKVVRLERVGLVQELAEVKARLATAAEPLRRNSRNFWQPLSQDKPKQQTVAKRAWLWVEVTTVVTVFHIAASRSGAIARQLFGDEYHGVAGTDRYSGYHWLDPSQRQLCWRHLLRDFQKILERGEESYAIGCNLKLQTEYLLVVRARVRDGTLALRGVPGRIPGHSMSHSLLADPSHPVPLPQYRRYLSSPDRLGRRRATFGFLALCDHAWRRER